MKTALELSISPELDKDDLIEEQPHEIQRLGNRRCFISGFSHFEVVGGAGVFRLKQ